MRRVNYPVIVVLPFFLLACAASQQAEKKAGPEPSLKSLPHAVAVLPFGNETEEIGISGQARKSFSNHFSSKPYQRIEPYVVYEKIAQMGKTAGKTVFEIPSGDKQLNFIMERLEGK